MESQKLKELSFYIAFRKVLFLGKTNDKISKKSKIPNIWALFGQNEFSTKIAFRHTLASIVH